LLVGGRDLNLKDKVKLNYYPEHRPLEIAFDGKPLRVADAESFVGAYQEIFLDRVYEFTSSNDRPFIIDGGANIGLATLFFKKNYPNSIITAFEADPIIFKTLEWNINCRGLKDVEVIKAALWNLDTSLPFLSEGSASGHVATSGEFGNLVPVTAVRLKAWLQSKIDFLKLDIEGAEYEVLEDCREELTNVENLFVEYHSRVNAEQRLSTILQILSAAGFRYHVHEAFTSRQPFMNRAVLGQMDLQLNIFAFRL
jgi:FkbM family methyltransferase